MARRELDFELGGMLSREDGSGEFVDWARMSLHVGDTLVLEIVDIKHADKPRSRRPANGRPTA
jgi:hypothetical protein